MAEMPAALLQLDHWQYFVTTMLLIPRSFLFVWVSLPRTNRKLCQTVVKHAFHSLHCTRMQKIWSTWSTQACSMTASQVHKSLALSIGEFRIPGRPRTSDCFCAKARLMRVTSPIKKTNKHEKTAADLPKRGKIWNVERFWRSQNLLTGLRNHCFKQQKKNLLVITKKNNEPNQKLTKMVVGEWWVQ